MSDDDKKLARRFFNRSLAPKEKKKKDIQIIPPKPKRSFLGQKLDTRRIEEYEKTLKAVEKVVKASIDLEEGVGDLNNVDIRIEANKNKFLANLEESKQRLEALMNNTELTEERRKAEIMEEKKKQAEAEAEIMEYEAKKAESRAKIAEAEEKIRKAKDPFFQQLKPKTRIDKINALERETRKIKQVIAGHLKRAEKAIEEEGKLRGLTAKDIEEKKDLEKARWDRIEMEELEKIRGKYK